MMTTGDQRLTGEGTVTRPPAGRVHADAIDAFIAAANTGDPDRRARLLSLALAPDVSFHGPLGRGVGRGAVEDFLTEVVQSYPAGRCRMVRTTVVDAPHEWARFGWRFESADGTAVLRGTDMVHFTAAGDIDEIVVFTGSLQQEG
ncbi:nuclear transport factor 2 family protein [Nonomuraea bangladeshensis]|uniref:nuclear transport factor 2 family protein n=1 Tax=Nonomuraea bangladeshensis TaxID=404385 RepID=UPI003C2B1EA6